MPPHTHTFSSFASSFREKRLIFEGGAPAEGSAEKYQEHSDAIKEIDTVDEWEKYQDRLGKEDLSSMTKEHLTQLRGLLQVQFDAKEELKKHVKDELDAINKHLSPEKSPTVPAAAVAGTGLLAGLGLDKIFGKEGGLGSLFGKDGIEGLSSLFGEDGISGLFSMNGIQRSWQVYLASLGKKNPDGTFQVSGITAWLVRALNSSGVNVARFKIDQIDAETGVKGVKAAAAVYGITTEITWEPTAWPKFMRGLEDVREKTPISADAYIQDYIVDRLRDRQDNGRAIAATIALSDIPALNRPDGEKASEAAESVVDAGEATPEDPSGDEETPPADAGEATTEEGALDKDESADLPLNVATPLTSLQFEMTLDPGPPMKKFHINMEKSPQELEIGDEKFQMTVLNVSIPKFYIEPRQVPGEKSLMNSVLIIENIHTAKARIPLNEVVGKKSSEFKGAVDVLIEKKKEKGNGRRLAYAWQAFRALPFVP